MEIKLPYSQHSCGVYRGTEQAQIWMTQTTETMIANFTYIIKINDIQLTVFTTTLPSEWGRTEQICLPIQFLLVLADACHHTG